MRSCKKYSEKNIEDASAHSQKYQKVPKTTGMHIGELIKEMEFD
jgi:hypothetical protein